MPVHNFPVQLTPFIGRDEEVSEIIHLLADSECRLLTLVGPGGIGKTRLALEAARQFGSLPDIYFVALQHLESSHLIVSAIAEALDFQFYQTDDAQQQLLAYLREKSLLLILDNFEHLLDGVGLVSNILTYAPGVKVLVTSREALNLHEEWSYPVKGMRFPQNDQPTNAEDFSAVRLFAQNARRIRADFSLAEEEAGVIRICALVEGMPLGIELAAAWVRTLSCAEIANEIERSLDILATTARNAPERHRNMRAVLEQSWRQLPEAEQEVFKKLSVFRGGITRPAAQAIAGSSLITLSALVDKSFLWHERHERYHIHELLRQYGEEQLNLSREESQRVCDLHCAYFVDFIQRREADLKGHRQLGALNEIEADYENVRVAWNWAVEHKNGSALQQSLESLYLFGSMRNRFLEGRELLGRAGERLAGESKEELERLWGRILVRWILMWRLQETAPESYERMKTQAEQSLAIARKYSDPSEIAFCWWTLGLLAGEVGDHTGALTPFQESHTLYSKLDDRFYMAMAADFLGAGYGWLRQQDNFVKFTQQSLDLRRQIGDQFGIASSLYNFAQTELMAGQYAEAERDLREISRIYVELGNQAWKARTSGQLAWIDFCKGNFEKAKMRAEEALKITSESIRGGKWQALSTLGWLASMEEDYTTGKQLCEDAAPYEIYVYFSQAGLAIAACGEGDYRAARQRLQMVLQRGVSFHELAPMAGALPIAAIILAHGEEWERAVELLGLAFHQPANATGWLEKWPLLQRLLADLRGRLAPGVFQAAWERGKNRDLETVATALLGQFQDVDTPRPATVPSASVAQQSLPRLLSQRELEVLRLIADGLSNPEIAQRLFLSPGTIKVHTRNIYSKLDVNGRIQAVASAKTLHLL